MCRSYSPSRIRRLSVRVPCSCLSSWGGGVKKGKKGKRPLLEAHCCSVKIVRHQSAVAPEKRKRGRRQKKTLRCPQTYLHSLPFVAVCLSFFTSSSLPTPPFSTIFSYSLHVSLSFFHTLSWPSGYDPAAYTNRDWYTGGNDKNVLREIWMETGGKAEAWETAKWWAHDSVFCLKRISERATTRRGELTKHHHRSASATIDSPVLLSLLLLVSCTLQKPKLLSMNLGSKGLQNQAVCVLFLFSFPALYLAHSFWKKCCEIKGKTELT